MIWPNATDYNAAVQNPQLCFRDDDLRQGQAVGDLFGLPRPHSGNFADVYQIQAADGQSWAVKCFTRPVAGLRPRYHAICEHLRHTQRAFMVEFHYLDEGMCIRGQWHPLVKMRWVEGFRLNEFIRDHLNKPALLDRLAQLWLRLAQDLRDSDMAHGDLQHGNVLLVPGGKGSSLSLKLIDYDGMFVPSLADHPSGEVGHPHYQHPRRLREGGYGRDMDRFAHLLIYTSLRCLRIGGEELWQRYDNLENMLFREEDFRQPNQSRLLHELWEMEDSEIHGLVGHLLLASQGALEMVPTLDELVDDSGIRPLSDIEEARANDLLKDAAPSRDRSSFRRSRNGRTKSQTAVRAAALLDTNPILLDEKTIEEPVPVLPRTPRRSAAEIELDAQPPAAAIDRSPFEVAGLTDPLVSMLSHPAWLATLGAIALVSFLVINVMMWASVKQPTTVAIRRPILAEIGEVVLKSGFKKSIPLDVERHGSQGPLTLRIEGLPDELKVPPLTLPSNEDRVSLTLLAPLGIVLPPCAARVSLWEGDDKVDEKVMYLSVQTVPRPLLKAVDKITCEAGREAEFVFAVERNDCREPLSVRLDGLPPQVRQESAAAANTNRLSMELSVADDFAPQSIPLRLRLHVGDIIADSKELILNIQEHTRPKRLDREQITRVRLKDETPKSLAVEAGAKGQLRIFLDRGGYQGEVQVQLTDLPSGVTAHPTVVPATDSATVPVETKMDAGIGEHRVHLLVQVNKQTVDRRDLTLSVSKPRGRQERIHFTTLDHMQLAGTLYHGWKGKRGMTVLMLHDLGSNRSTPGWKRLAESLQAEGYTVLTFDFRGHGESKKVSPRFWNYSVNKFLPAHEPGLPAQRQPRTLGAESLPSGYMPWLIEDIAAARTYLDLRHDDPADPVNTFNLVVVGAGQASALGSLWLATEGLRYNGSDVGNKILLKWPEKLSVLQAVWIGMADPLKLRPFGIHGWLEGAHAKPVVPITFIYGEDDVDTSTLLSLPIREKQGKPIVIRNTRLSGQQLLDADAQSAAQIQQYLVKTLQTLPPVNWVPRKIKTLRSFWKIPLSLPGGREQERWFVAKRPGEETLMPVPFQPLNIPSIKGLAEPTSFVPEQSEP